MKIEIITFHNSSNFGATLQCTALSKFLAEKGFETEVINYLPSYVTDKTGINKELKKISSAKNKVKATIKSFAYLLHVKQVMSRKEHFDSFIQEQLKLSRKYSSYESLCAAPPNADLFICGSDQIWNPALTGGKLDEAFFLRFTSAKKASYGASLGEMNIEAHQEELAEFTDDFIGISVRESSSAERLSAVLNRPVETVLDCTLLLDKNDYSVMEKDVNALDRPYLLLYNIQNSAVTILLAKRIAAEKNLTIIDISPNPFVKISNARKMIDIGPGEFLRLFHEASYVITNSFHGTVFSIIYEKQFITVPHSTRSLRVINLLKILGIQDRIALESGYIDRNPVDYSVLHEKLQAARHQSIAYLESLISNADKNNEDIVSHCSQIPEKQQTIQSVNSVNGLKELPNLVEQRVMCCGCAACLNICRQNAIEMREDREGFLYPHVNADLCIRCYMCLNACVFKKEFPF